MYDTGCNPFTAGFKATVVSCLLTVLCRTFYSQEPVDLGGFVSWSMRLQGSFACQENWRNRIEICSSSPNTAVFSVNVNAERKRKNTSKYFLNNDEKQVLRYSLSSQSYESHAVLKSHLHSFYQGSWKRFKTWKDKSVYRLSIFSVGMISALSRGRVWSPFQLGVTWFVTHRVRALCDNSSDDCEEDKFRPRAVLL